MLKSVLYLFFLILTGFEVCGQLVIGLPELLEPLVFGFLLPLDFQLMVDCDFLHEEYIQVVHHGLKLIVQGSLANDMLDEPFDVMNLLLEIVLFLLLQW